MPKIVQVAQGIGFRCLDHDHESAAVHGGQILRTPESLQIVLAIVSGGKDAAVAIAELVGDDLPVGRYESGAAVQSFEVGIQNAIPLR